MGSHDTAAFATTQRALSRRAEIASAAQIDDAIGIEMHKRIGYTEVERQVCFLKRLTQRDRKERVFANPLLIP